MIPCHQMNNDVKALRQIVGVSIHPVHPLALAALHIGTLAVLSWWHVFKTQRAFLSVAITRGEICW